VRLTIQFASGSPFVVEAEVDATRFRNMASNIEKALDASYFGIEVDGSLHIFPIHTIRSIEITPGPGVAMKNVVRDVRRVAG
jgi:hypothetical protein